MPAEAQPALKDWFNLARYRQIADLLADSHPGFDRKHFLAIATVGLDDLTLIQRVRRTTEACRATLPPDYLAALRVLRRVAPHIRHNFVGIFLSDFAGQYGHGHVAKSLAALEYFTPYASAEFAIREFLRRDLPGTLAVMEQWSQSDNEHVRRLASEGCRPRLPWSFQLKELVANPSLTAGILENLRADPSLYVRKSVANHLNDITKDHPDWVLDRLATWDLKHPHTQWIAKRACRTLLKQGNERALKLFHFIPQPAVKVTAFRLTPRRLNLGDAITFTFALSSTSSQIQRLAVDYLIHYVKARGGTASKIFKLREFQLDAGEQIIIRKRQVIRDFTTRRHYPGRHRIELQINGQIHGGTFFDLSLFN